MNKPLNLLSSLILAALLLGSVGHAQQGPGGPNPAMRAQFEKYRPVFDLISSVRMMSDVDKQKGLAFTKAQAKLLLPVLKDLQTRAAVQPADADKILANIEDKILTAAQLKWMDAEQLRLQEERRKRAQQGQNGGGFSLPNPNGPGGGQNQQAGQGGNRQGGGMFQAIQQGKPFNPFKEGRAQEALTTLIALLEKR